MWFMGFLNLVQIFLSPHSQTNTPLATLIRHNTVDKYTKYDRKLLKERQLTQYSTDINDSKGKNNLMGAS